MGAIKPAWAGDAALHDAHRDRRFATLWNLGRRGAGEGWPPFVAFVAGWLVVASRVPGGWAAAFNPASWDRNDSGQYLKIARHGYRMSTYCGAATFPRPGLPGKRLCGNVTWFAGYPALMRALSLTGVSVMAAGLIIAWLAWYLTLLMIWLLARPEASGFFAAGRRWACVLLAAVFPGQVYFAAIFPISLATFGMLACVYFATRLPRRWPALIAGALAGSAYLASVAVLPGLALAFVVRWGRQHRTTLAFAGAGVCVGVLAVLGYAQWAVGHWNAYFMTERLEYRVGMHNPLPALATRFHQVWPLPLPGAGRTIAEQTLVVWVVLALAVVGFAILRGAPSRHRRGRAILTSSDLVMLVTAVAGWVIPYVGGGRLSVYRAEALVIVAVPLLRRVPMVLLLPLMLGATWVAWQMAPLFFNRVLV
jgi:hypothetical protein